MQSQNSSFIYCQDAEQNFLEHTQQLESFCSRNDRSVIFDHSSSKNKSTSKQSRTHNKRNANRELQELLQSDTVIYGNTSNLSTQKKRLFTQLSFFSKDHTQDHTNQQGYNQLVQKIHFEKARHKDLNQELAEEKEKLIQEYLSDLVQEFRQLSDQNQRLREIYKKEAGGGYKILKKNSSMKIDDNKRYQTNQQFTQNNNQTPRNSTLKTGRKSIATVSNMQPQANYPVSRPSTNRTPQYFCGLGQNFFPSKKLQTLKMNNTQKMHNCESSIDICGGQSVVPSPYRHKRRESQLTERKEYKGQGMEEFLMVDDRSEVGYEDEGRLSCQGRMGKNREELHWAKAQRVKQCLITPPNPNPLLTSMQTSSLQYHPIPQPLPLPTSTKNIFLQFLQHLLLQQRCLYTQMSTQLSQQVKQQQVCFQVPSYHNIKMIEELEREIVMRNNRVRQLEGVVTVFKDEIEGIVGGDLKMVDGIMLELIQVKGKWIEMQRRVEGIRGLKQELEHKERVKHDIIQQLSDKVDKQNKQNKQHTQPQSKNASPQPFPIPNSLTTLFQLLNIQLPNPRPRDYLTTIKTLPQNRELFQAYESKKRAQCNIKIKEVIDMIREGRKKFSQVIKIYEGRINKLQQKLAKYKQGNTIKEPKQRAKDK